MSKPFLGLVRRTPPEAGNIFLGLLPHMLAFARQAQTVAVMSIYQCLCEYVPAKTLRAYASKPMEDRVGIFFNDGLAEHLDEACVDWRQLLMAIITVSVEPKRLDIEKALGRLDASRDGDKKLFHDGEEHNLGKRMQSQGIKMMISHIALKKRSCISKAIFFIVVNRKKEM